MLINRIIRNAYPEYTLNGLSFSEIQEMFVTPLVDISEIRQAQEKDGLLCVIYDDTPLVTDSLFISLAERCLAEKTGFFIGNGFIVPTDHKGKLNQTEMPEATLFHPSLYSDFRKIVNRRILRSFSSCGVKIHDFNNTYIDAQVNICSGAVLYPFVTIEGNSYIGKNAVLMGDTHIKNAHIGDRASVFSSYIFDSTVGDDCTVGPFAYIRNQSKISSSCRIGDFVEIKNSVLGEKVKCAHLTYVGDATVGNNTNVGCGTVFCNYDGKTKHHTTVGENVFIGANTNLIAPLTVGSDSFLAAGGTIGKDVPPDSFVIARATQSTHAKRVPPVYK